MDIKICGITNLEDAMSAVHAGADAIGFIFYRKSPRYVTPESAKDIIKKLPGNICKIGVFVNHVADEVKDILAFCGLNMAQLHGVESPEYCLQFHRSVLIKSISPHNAHDPVLMQKFPVKAILLDALDTKCYGGTGKLSDWDIGVHLKEKYPLILAGGLNIKNIFEAIQTVSPHAVDVNSGVEVFPGKKDALKIKNMVKAIRAMPEKSATTVFTR